jgi:hypothetical protein
MASEATQPQDSSTAAGGPGLEPGAGNLSGTPDQPTGAEPEATEAEPEPTDAAAGPQERHSASPPPGPSAVMPLHIFVVAVVYLVALIVLFVIYVSWQAFRSHVPASFGQLPAGVVWFAATGGVIASLYGIFVHNQTWDSSYNYWHYCRPIFGGVTGSVGALIYLVLLNLGSKSAVKVDTPTFFVVAFVFGFADKSFMQMLQNVTNVIIKPGGKASPVNSKGSSNDGGNQPGNG